jgi:hypothetical protein
MCFYGSFFQSMLLAWWRLVLNFEILMMVTMTTTSEMSNCLTKLNESTPFENLIVS